MELVGKLVKARRLELGHTQQKAAELADVSLSTWNLLETGRRARFEDLTLAQVAKSLGWPSSALARLLDGEDPDEVIPPAQSVRPHTVAATVQVPSPTVTAIPDGVAFASELPDWEQWSPEEKQGVLDAVHLVMRGAAEKHRRRSTN